MFLLLLLRELETNLDGFGDGRDGDLSGTGGDGGDVEDGGRGVVEVVVGILRKKKTSVSSPQERRRANRTRVKLLKVLPVAQLISEASVILHGPLLEFILNSTPAEIVLTEASSAAR